MKENRRQRGEREKVQPWRKSLSEESSILAFCWLNGKMEGGKSRRRMKGEERKASEKVTSPFC